MFQIACSKKNLGLGKDLKWLLEQNREKVILFEIKLEDGGEEDILSVTRYGQGACHTFSNEELFQIILDLLKKLSDKVGIAKTLSGRFPN